MENKTTIHFRKNENDELISVTEFNTRITYTKDNLFTIGRLEVSYQRTLIIATARARARYFIGTRIYSPIDRIFRALGCKTRLTY
jgi:hypothetical protein